MNKLDLTIDGLRIDNSGNIVNSFDCEAIGRDSYIGFRSNNSLINGHDNVIQDNCPNCYISGSNNVIQSGASNSSIIGGSGYTISEPNTVIVGGATFVDGIKKLNIVFTSVDLELTNENEIVIVDTVDGVIDIDLPDSPVAGQRLEIVKGSNDIYTVNVAGGGNTINGEPDAKITQYNERWMMIFTGQQWQI